MLGSAVEQLRGQVAVHQTRELQLRRDFGGRRFDWRHNGSPFHRTVEGGEYTIFPARPYTRRSYLLTNKGSPAPCVVDLSEWHLSCGLP
jgi:hypothetical protein